MSTKQTKTVTLCGGPHDGMEVTYGKFETLPNIIAFQKYENHKFLVDDYVRQGDSDTYNYREVKKDGE